MADKKSTQVNKSAVTGEFVSNREMKKHPKTTYKQSVQKTTKRPQKKG